MKLMIDISEDLYNNMKSRFKYQNETDDNLSGFEKIGIAVKNGTPLEAQSNRCDSCKHSEERDGSNCYECVKGMADNFEAQPCEDCRNCKKWNKCSCGKEGHENGTSIGYSIGECKDYEPCEDCINSKRRKLNE